MDWKNVYYDCQLTNAGFPEKLAIYKINITPKNTNYALQNSVTHLIIDRRVTFLPVKFRIFQKQGKEYFWESLLKKNGLIYLSLACAHKFDRAWKLAYQTPLSVTLVHLRLTFFYEIERMLFQIARAVQLNEVLEELSLELKRSRVSPKIEAVLFESLIKRRMATEFSLQGTTRCERLIARLLRERRSSHVFFRLKGFAIERVPSYKAAVVFLGACDRSGVLVSLDTEVSKLLITAFSKSEAAYLRHHAKALYIIQSAQK